MADSRSIFKSALIPLGNKKDVWVAAGVIVVIAMMIIPLPTVLLDTFQSFNFMLSLLVILLVLFVRHTTDFTVFPTLLLISTLFSIGLNIASTRLILLHGSAFDGKLIKAFSSFVVGTKEAKGLVIGFIIFIILIAVQYIVITKGATRVAEVAARFTLDGMVQKQMSIDAEIASGALTEDEAMQKRRRLQKEVDFYSAMDGATKFVSGNVKIGILTILVDIIGGMIIGMVYHGEPFNIALVNYVTLTIGDGLVTQFPSLLIATATGIIVTRSVSDGSFASDVTNQFSQDSKIYIIAAVFLFLLSFLPGFPWYVLIPMAALSGLTGYSISRKKVAADAAEKAEKRDEKQKEESAFEIPGIEPLDPLSLELGYGLLPLVDKEKGADLLERITMIRRETAAELGLIVPKIRVRDNMKLDPSEYCLKIKGVEIGRAKIRLNHYLAINQGSIDEPISGEKTTDPAFGLPALWISEKDREKAEQAGYLIVDPPSIIATHLTGIIKKHSSEILGRQEVRAIIDSLAGKYPTIIEEIRNALSIGEIQKVLQNLLKEQVSIRNMVVILETLTDFSSVSKVSEASKDITYLTEKVRQALGRQICLQYADEEKKLNVVTINSALEIKINESRVGDGYSVDLDREYLSSFLNAASNLLIDFKDLKKNVVVLTSETVRVLVRKIFERGYPGIAIISMKELTEDIRIEILGEINFEMQNT
ncbi:MAG: flagellar biosynthesis protein FlhA [Spirochaetaceae bacterium]|nr:flagellar biosynthesis protein FlhA [Spirochaetaceae bacterium]